MNHKSKTLLVGPAPFGNHYHIFFKEGGTIPEELRGMYTSPEFAYRAIEAYKSGQPLLRPPQRAAEEAAAEE